MTDLTPRLVTPEAVVLQFETAGLASRLLAFLLDALVQAALLVLLAFAAIAFGDAVSGAAARVLLLTAVTVVLLGYPIALETLWRGRTLGKAALGLRVVTRDGAPIRFRHAAVRGFLGLVDFWLTTGAAAVISVLLTRDNQRLGDLAAGTLVLRERSGAGTPRSVQFTVPYGYETYAATLDTSGLGADEYGAVRSFLLRVPSLPAPVRNALAVEVAGPVAARMHHVAPPGVSAEAFLACVAALHQRRSAPASPADVPSGWAPAADVWAARSEATATTAPVPRPAPIDGGFVPPGA